MPTARPKIVTILINAGAAVDAVSDYSNPPFGVMVIDAAGASVRHWRCPLDMHVRATS